MRSLLWRVPDLFILAFLVFAFHMCMGCLPSPKEREFRCTPQELEMAEKHFETCSYVYTRSYCYPLIFNQYCRRVENLQ